MNWEIIGNVMLGMLFYNIASIIWGMILYSPKPKQQTQLKKSRFQERLEEMERKHKQQ